MKRSHSIKRSISELSRSAEQSSRSSIKNCLKRNTILVQNLNYDIIKCTSNSTHPTKDSTLASESNSTFTSLSSIAKQLELFTFDKKSSVISSTASLLLSQQRSGAKDVQDHIKAMEKNPNDAEFQAWSCFMISKWAVTNDHFRLIIVSSGGILNILNAMAMHPDCENVQAQACYALGRLGGSNVAYRATIVAMNGIKSIALAMTLHPHSKHVKAGACFAMKQLTSKLSHNTKGTTRTNKIRTIFEEAIRS